MILKEIFRSLNNINSVSVPRISSFSVQRLFSFENLSDLFNQKAKISGSVHNT